jgi:hypothetical protein
MLNQTKTLCWPETQLVGIFASLQLRYPDGHYTGPCAIQSKRPCQLNRVCLSIRECVRLTVKERITCFSQPSAVITTVVSTVYKSNKQQYIRNFKYLICLYNRRVGWYLAWLVDDHLLLRDYKPCGVIFMEVFCYSHCHSNYATDFGPYEIIFGTMCLLRAG